MCPSKGGFGPKAWLWFLSVPQWLQETANFMASISKPPSGWKGSLWSCGAPRCGTGWGPLPAPMSTWRGGEMVLLGWSQWEKRQECGARMVLSGSCQPCGATLAPTSALSGKPLWDEGRVWGSLKNGLLHSSSVMGWISKSIVQVRIHFLSSLLLLKCLPPRAFPLMSSWLPLPFHLTLLKCHLLSWFI